MLLDDASEETRVNVVAVVRSICDHPAGRTMFTRCGPPLHLGTPNQPLLRLVAGLQLC